MEDDGVNESGGGRSGLLAQLPADAEPYAWCSRMMQPVTEMKLKLLGLYYDDLEFHELLRWLPQQPVITALEKNVSLSYTEVTSSPMGHIQEKCRQSAEGLAQGNVILCVYGGVNVGKSTLCNLLLGSELLHVTSVQCTAVPAIVHSAPFKDEARVFFADGVDLEQTFAAMEERKPALQGSERWEQCKKLLTDLDKRRKERGTDYATLEDLKETLPIVSSLSLDLRREKILNRIEVRAPVLGMEENGLCLVDCPGLQENEFLTYVAQSQAQNSAVILFVMNCFTGISDEDLHFLAAQAVNGCDVLFVFNRKDTDQPEAVAEKLLDVRSKINAKEPFEKAIVYQINAMDGHAQGLAPYIDHVQGRDVFELDEVAQETTKGLTDFLHQLGQTVTKRSRGMIFQFARSFYQLMQTQYLVISRLVAAKMRQPGSSFSMLPFKKKTSRERDMDLAQKKMKKLRSDIRALVKEADASIAHYKRDFSSVFRRVLSRMEPSLLILARSATVSAEYTPNEDTWIRNVVNVLYNKAPSEFEEQLYQQVVNAFLLAYKKEYVDWITKVRLEFSKSILQRANGIEHEANVLRNELAKQSVSGHMEEVFRQTERQIGDLFAAQMAIAGPLVGVLAGGATVTVPWLLVGAVSTAFLAGGMMLLAGVALAGIVTSVVSVGYVQKISNRTEEETREAVFQAVVNNLADVPGTKAFKHMVGEAVIPCVIMRDYVQSTLSMSLLQVESLSSVTDVDMTYEDLCNFLYIRESLSEKLQQLGTALHDFDQRHQLDMGSLIAQMEKALKMKHRQIQGVMLSRKTSMDNMLGCSYPQCFICGQEFVHCSHLCAPCRTQLDAMDSSPCPACNKGSRLSARASSEGGFSFQLDADDLDLGHLEEEEPAQNFLPLYMNEKARVMRKLQGQSRLLSDFTSWFNSTHGEYQSHMITARNSIDLFISSFIQHLSPAGGQLPDVYRRIVTECLHELVYPHVYETLLGVYHKQFKEKDQEIADVCLRLADKDPMYYQEEMEWGEEQIGRFSDAIAILKRVGTLAVPLEKLHALVDAFASFNASLQEGCSVGADLLVPTLVYFLVQANIPSLRSVITLMHDALDQTGLMKPDEEYLFVTVQSLVVEFPKICSHYNEAGDSALRI